MRHHRTLEASLVMCIGLATPWAIRTAPAHADGPDPNQSLCEMLAQSGSTLVSALADLTNATSEITGKQGPDKGMAQMFTQHAVSQYCPDAMTSMNSGRLPNIPFVISDRPDVTGIFGGAPKPPGGLPGPPGLPGP